MLQNFTIFKSKDKLREQWDFMEKRAADNSLMSVKKTVIIAIILGLAYLLLLTTTPINDYVVLKVLLTVFTGGWSIVLVLVLSMSIYRKVRYKKFIDNYLVSTTSKQLNYQVEIHEENIKIIFGIIFHEYMWTDFHIYGINNDNIYVFNETKPGDSLFWSKDEMGEDNYLYLIEILNKKSIKRLF